MGDFNGDGALDVAACGGDHVRVLLGNGDGTFKTAVSYLVNHNPEGIALGDFNGDGILDLVTENFYGFGVSVLLGNGDGSFQPSRGFELGAVPPSAVVAADFNGDGLDDVAVALRDEAKVSVMLSASDGNGPTRVFGPRPRRADKMAGVLATFAAPAVAPVFGPMSSGPELSFLSVISTQLPAAFEERLDPQHAAENPSRASVSVSAFRHLASSPLFDPLDATAEGREFWSILGVAK